VVCSLDNFLLEDLKTEETFLNFASLKSILFIEQNKLI
jgi:hypothetical protein